MGGLDDTLNDDEQHQHQDKGDSLRDSRASLLSGRSGRKSRRQQLQQHHHHQHQHHQHQQQRQQQQHSDSQPDPIRLRRTGAKNYNTFEMDTVHVSGDEKPVAELETSAQDIVNTMLITKVYTDCVHFRIGKSPTSPQKSPEGKKKDEETKTDVFVVSTDVFVVSWGVVVLWNSNESITRRVKKLVMSCQIARTMDPQTEEMDFEFGLRRGVKNDLITLSKEKEGESAVFEKLAATFALAQSLKLSVLESRIDWQIDRVKHLPKELATYGQISSLSRKKVQMLLGQLFITHTDLTLTSELLDTPEFFWEQDTDLPFYKTMVLYLEIAKRTSTLNTRKDVLHELYEIIRESKETQQATRLEWIVIWLILVEVILECIQIAAGYFQYHWGEEV